MTIQDFFLLTLSFFAGAMFATAIEKMIEHWYGILHARHEIFTRVCNDAYLDFLFSMPAGTSLRPVINSEALTLVRLVVNEYERILRNGQYGMIGLYASDLRKEARRVYRPNQHDFYQTYAYRSRWQAGTDTSPPHHHGHPS